MAEGTCIACRAENQPVKRASCDIIAHSMCYVCICLFIEESLQSFTPYECFRCQGEAQCTGLFSFASLREVLNQHPDGSKLIIQLQEAEARHLFIMQKKTQEILL